MTQTNRKPNPMQNYKILKVIGKGAFGDAYLGINIKQKKQYVIKQVDIKNKTQSDKQNIFHQVKLLQAFNHVNIVSYRDSFIDKKGLMNIVMEYCQGGDMNQLIESLQGNKIPQDKIVYWLAQIALAIFYMHQKKILHRDLKSPNIFILKGNIRLGDFGISKVLDHVRDLAQTNIGTPYYMSPQQYNHKPYSYKSDIWAFGCILYEMCNQRRPFQANNLQALGMKVVRGNFPPVSQCYSKDLRNLISDMLQKNPAKRPNVIQILLKPFVKKKLAQYMRTIYSKKQQISKQSLYSLQQQAKKLSVPLQQKRPSNVLKTSQTQQTQRQRSTSAKKKRAQQQKQIQKQQRQRKKLQLQNQLNKHNKQRKQMAEKLKKIQQERKMLLNKKKSQKSIKAIYEKIQENNQNKVISNNNNQNLQKQKKQYQSQKYSVASSGTNVNEGKKNQAVVEQVAKNVNVVVETKPQQKKKTPVPVVIQQKIKQPKPQKQKPKISSQLTTNPTTKSTTPTTTPLQKHEPQKIVQNKSFIQQKKNFKMQQQYEMQFQDCQPENYYQDQDYEEDQNLQSKTQQQFQSQNRLPTFAKDQDKLAKQVQDIKNLVQVTNQAVQGLDKLEHKTNSANGNVNVNVNDKQIIIEKSQQKIEQKVENLKQQIKMKTQHINSIRNQLSNIDFQLSQSDDQKHQVQKIQIIQQKPNFKKKRFNSQHAIVNDKINTLKDSAQTILGTQQYNKFYEYLSLMKQKGRTIKRDYLQQVLGKQKIGVYHLVQNIVKLTKVLNKIPKWLQ